MANPKMWAAIVLVVLLSAAKVRAQETTIATKLTANNPVAVSVRESTKPKQEHRFWDKENSGLFAGVGASRTLDYFSTLNMRRRGNEEMLLTNDIVDNHAAFAAIEAAGVDASIGTSYLFHRSGHHKLERWTSIVHIGLTTSSAVRNYCLKDASGRSFALASNDSN